MERKVIINGRPIVFLFQRVRDAFRKKPVVVHAKQMSEPFEVHTDEGVMLGDPSDWLIKDVEGELYPCKDGIFKKTYEKAYEKTQALIAEAPKAGDGDVFKKFLEKEIKERAVPVALTTGLLLRDIRIRNGLTLRMFCLDRELDPTRYSMIERDILKPTMTEAYEYLNLIERKK